MPFQGLSLAGGSHAFSNQKEPTDQSSVQVSLKPLLVLVTLNFAFIPAR